MGNSFEIEKQVVFESLSELNWIDVKLFRLGTKLGDGNATKQEIAESLLDFFIENDIGNKIAKVKNTLREAIERDFKYDESGVSELDRMYEKKLDESPSNLSNTNPGKHEDTNQ